MKARKAEEVLNEHAAAQLADHPDSITCVIHKEGGEEESCGVSTVTNMTRVYDHPFSSTVARIVDGGGGTGTGALAAVGMTSLYPSVSQGLLNEEEANPNLVNSIISNPPNKLETTKQSDSAGSKVQVISKQEIKQEMNAFNNLNNKGPKTTLHENDHIHEHEYEQEQLESASRLLSQPGAFPSNDVDDVGTATGTSHHGGGGAMIINNESSQQQQESSQGDGDIIAVPIGGGDDEQVGTADPVTDQDKINTANAANDRHQRTNNFIKRSLLSLGAVCLVVIVLGVTLSLKKNANKQQPPPQETTATADDGGDDQTSIYSSFPQLQDTILGLFPNYTIQSIKEIPNSPQSMALEWLLQDPYLVHYMDKKWRVRQRFALATIYYGLSGENWTSRDGWLNYSRHECLWWSKPNFAFPVPFFETYNSLYNNPCEQHSSSIEESNSDPSSSNNNQEYRNLWLWVNNLKTLTPSSRSSTMSTNANHLIPEELYWLTSLSSLSLFGNDFGGGAKISTRIGQLTKLKAFAYSFCGMDGQLPSQMGMLTDVTFFAIGGNNFGGTIPLQLKNLQNLQTMLAYNNQLSGTIPQQLFSFHHHHGNNKNSVLPNLTYLDLDSNRLTGSLPSTIGLLTSLEQVLLYQNRFTGVIPSELGQLSSAKRLVLSSNNLSGSIPRELARLSSSLLTLELQNNQLTSQIPSQLGSMPFLSHLLLQNNQLSGSVPIELMMAMTTMNSSSSTVNDDDTSSPSLIVFNASGNAQLQLLHTHHQYYFEDDDYDYGGDYAYCWTDFWFNSTECQKKAENLEFPVHCGCDCSC